MRVTTCSVISVAVQLITTGGILCHAFNSRALLLVLRLGLSASLTWRSITDRRQLGATHRRRRTERCSHVAVNRSALIVLFGCSTVGLALPFIVGFALRFFFFLFRFPFFSNFFEL